jgi:hypothetical protein
MAQDQDQVEAELRRIINGYARCCDMRDGDGFAKLYAPGAVLEGPGFKNTTAEQIRAVPGSLSVFKKTYHTLLNTMFDINGDRASGVIYSMAHHLTPLSDGQYNDLVMYITYYDRYVRGPTGWRFENRRVEMEFTENRTVDNLGTMPKF